MKRPLPEGLHEAFNWTDAAGQIEELRLLRGIALLRYCVASARNYVDHYGQPPSHGLDVSSFARDIALLACWLRRE
jgi:hypothetical protein